MNIEFGCGETPTFSDYKTCDVRDLPGIDYVCNAWEITSQVDPDTVDHIFSRHFFEHLTFQQGHVFLEACYTILKKDGCYEMVLPNFLWHVRQWLTEDNAMGFNIEDPFKRGIEGLWGRQRGELEDLWDVHKSGYKKWQLELIMQEIGFDRMEWIDSSIKNLHLKAYK